MAKEGRKEDGSNSIIHERYDVGACSTDNDQSPEVAQGDGQAQQRTGKAAGRVGDGRSMRLQRHEKTKWLAGGFMH